VRRKKDFGAMYQLLPSLSWVSWASLLITHKSDPYEYSSSVYSWRFFKYYANCICNLFLHLPLLLKSSTVHGVTLEFSLKGHDAMDLGFRNYRKRRTNLSLKYPSSHPGPAINCLCDLLENLRIAGWIVTPLRDMSITQTPEWISITLQGKRMNIILCDKSHGEGKRLRGRVCLCR
jgi:hypothetical protein